MKWKILPKEYIPWLYLHCCIVWQSESSLLLLYQHLLRCAGEKIAYDDFNSRYLAYTKIVFILLLYLRMTGIMER